MDVEAHARGRVGTEVEDRPVGRDRELDAAVAHRLRHRRWRRRPELSACCRGALAPTSGPDDPQPKATTATSPANTGVNHLVSSIRIHRASPQSVRTPASSNRNALEDGCLHAPSSKFGKERHRLDRRSEPRRTGRHLTDLGERTREPRRGDTEHRARRDRGALDDAVHDRRPLPATPSPDLGAHRAESGRGITAARRREPAMDRSAQANRHSLDPRGRGREQLDAGGNQLALACTDRIGEPDQLVAAAAIVATASSRHSRLGSRCVRRASDAHAGPPTPKRATCTSSTESSTPPACRTRTSASPARAHNPRARSCHARVPVRGARGAR